MSTNNSTQTDEQRLAEIRERQRTRPLEAVADIEFLLSLLDFRVVTGPVDEEGHCDIPDCVVCESKRDIATPPATAAARDAAREVIDLFMFAVAVAHNHNSMLPRPNEAQIAAIITRHVAAQGVAPGWQPIETAPRDGSSILIANDRTVREVRWMISVDKGAPDGCWFVGGYNGWRLTWRPNKWMPLPSLEAGAEWRLVETAPKYETILLGARGLEGWIQMSGYRTNAGWYFIGGGWMGVEPTHWIPLPKPPGSVPSGEVEEQG